MLGLLTMQGKHLICVYRVVEALGTAHSNNTVSGFHSAGIYPLNRNIFSEEDFRSSYVTDRAAPESVKLISNSNKLCMHTPPPNPHTVDSETLIAPDVIQPHPKATVRKVSNRGRKAGKIRIKTKTPEQEEIIREKETENRKRQTEYKDGAEKAMQKQYWKDKGKDSEDYNDEITISEFVAEDT